MCSSRQTNVSPKTRSTRKASKTRSKFQLLIENYAKLIIKIKKILKTFIFKYITKSCYLIIYGLENIFKEK